MNDALALPLGQPVAKGNTYTVLPPVPDQAAGRRALAKLVERLDTWNRVDEAVREYEERVESGQPYEDLVDADELRARYGA